MESGLKTIYQNFIEEALKFQKIEAEKEDPCLGKAKTLLEIVRFCVARLFGGEPDLEADVIRAAIVDYDLPPEIGDLWGEVMMAESIVTGRCHGNGTV